MNFIVNQYWASTGPRSEISDQVKKRVYPSKSQRKQFDYLLMGG